MVARQTLTLFVWVQILVPQPPENPDFTGFSVFMAFVNQKTVQIAYNITLLYLKKLISVRVVFNHSKLRISLFRGYTDKVGYLMHMKLVIKNSRYRFNCIH